MPSDQHKRKFIGCEVLYREACLLAATCPDRIDVEFLQKGLHDLPRADMLAKLQAVVDAVDTQAGYDAILLGYARCNDGLVGLQARSIPLVLPRAHDCITFFFGSRQAYQEYFDACPGTYFSTSGWVERNNFAEGQYSQPAYGQQGVMGRLGLTDSMAQLIEKYGKDNADFIAEFLSGWEKNYTKGLYLKMDTCDEQPFIQAARQDADKKGLEFQLRQGDWSLLKKLFWGRWDDDFLIVPPGQHIIARNDQAIVDSSL